jgi:hypothetical protein
MKNLLITHKEVQLQLFLAISYGIMKHFPGYIIVADNLERDFQWRLVDADVPSGAAFKDGLVFYQIDKGCSAMNDIRIGVTVDHLREHADTFIDKVRGWLAASPLAKSVNYFPSPAPVIES